MFVVQHTFDWLGACEPLADSLSLFRDGRLRWDPCASLALAL